MRIRGFTLDIQRNQTRERRWEQITEALKPGMRVLVSDMFE
jgi:hypothetical protein